MLKEVSIPFQVVASASVSAANTYTSSASNVMYKDTIGYQISWTGDPTGIWQINGSFDYNPGQPQSGGRPNAGTWCTIASVAAVSGMNQPVVFNMQQIVFPWVQFQFVSSTSSGVLGVWHTAKSLG